MSNTTNYLEYDDTFEKQIISCIINRPKSIEKVYTDKYFKTIKYSNLLNELREIYKKYRTIDFPTLSKEKISIDITELFEISESFVSENNLEYFQTKQIEIYRRIESQKLMESYKKGDIEFSELSKGINALNEEHYEDLNIIEEHTSDEVFQMITTKGDILKFTKYTIFSNYFNFQKHICYVIGARPAVGKTAFALNLIVDLMKNYICVYFNMEMNSSQLYSRMTGIISNLEINNFKKNDFVNSGNNYYCLRSAVDSIIQNNNFKIVNGGKKVSEIENVIAKINQETGRHVIAFIDHIGYVKSDHSVSGEYEKITDCMRELQLITKKLDCTLFILAHTKRNNNDGTMDSLKGSGELEQSAHAILILENKEEDPNNMKPTLELIIAKNRDGNTGKLEVVYDKKTQRMEME